VLKGLFEELSEEGAHEIGWLHRGYMWVCSAKEKRARDEGSLRRLQDEDAHLGAVEQVA
jgi:hypothetical protein